MNRSSSDADALSYRPAAALRPARPDDAPAIADVYMRSRTQLLPFAPLKHTAADILEWVTEWLLPSGELVVAVEGSRVVGLSAASSAYGVMWLDQLYVDPDRVGQGIGSTLLVEVLTRAQSAVQLYTFSENTRARAFYERHGFVVVSQSDGSDNEEGVPDVLYRRPFDPSSM
ncbi:GNAT family N-acetyltransferase [Pararobbsia alpina]|uniref:GNAT family N-acetyltransferase n=1 Tax=Pararobbsia alpina TaxID=621374 RepID=UPI0039A4AB9B